VKSKAPVVALFVSLGALALVVFAGLRAIPHISEDLGFKSITGVSTPRDVQVVGHDSRVDDNFFHETHFWILFGSIQAFREVARRFHLERSDEDASGTLQGIKGVLALSGRREDLLEGYEGSLDGGRDRWLIIMRDGRHAVFVY